MKTVSENLITRIEHLGSLLRELVGEQPGELSDINDGGGVVFIGASHAWPDLDQAGRRLQVQLRTEHEHLSATLTSLLKALPEGSLGQLTEALKTLSDLIDQSYLTWFSTRAEALREGEAALDQCRALVNDLHDPSAGEATVIVPDTNALIHNPALEDWAFPDLGVFVVVLTSTVLGELDKLKIEHRNEDVRRKAESLIRRVKSYRSRGNVLEGVPLRSGVSTLRTSAVEPDVAATLPWLDRGNADDRIVATVVETMRQYPRSAVVGVTRDVNLQNKLDYSGIPYVEPPDP